MDEERYMDWDEGEPVNDEDFDDDMSWDEFYSMKLSHEEMGR